MNSALQYQNAQKLLMIIDLLGEMILKSPHVVVTETTLTLKHGVKKGIGFTIQDSITYLI